MISYLDYRASARTFFFVACTGTCLLFRLVFLCPTSCADCCQFMRHVASFYMTLSQMMLKLPPVRINSAGITRAEEYEL